MRTCCLKMNLPLEDAKKRYCDWIDEEIDQSVHIEEREDGWTYFVDLEGEAFFGLTNESWLELAMDNSVTYAYYDEDFNAELIVIENGKLIREFSLYEDEPDANVNFGTFEYEKNSPIEVWNDVATFLETELTI
ncbi:hypothetical protein [Lysinibacillus agricola]|uniref:hypothetical protein n=1 Tax=Lysinibacillus agricola TaxID=2590012 RepID=UPI003C1B84D1